MNKWILCDGDLAIAQYEMEQELFNRCTVPERFYRVQKSNSKRSLKQDGRGSQKHSLKSVKRSLKTKQEVSLQYNSIKQVSPVVSEPGSPVFFKNFSIKSSEKITQPKIFLQRNQTPRFNVQASQAYCFNPPSPGLPQRKIYQSNVRINYVNMPEKSKFSPCSTEGSLVQSEVPQRHLKRMQTLPTNIYYEGSQIEKKKEIQQKKQEQTYMTKSLDYVNYQQKKVVNLKSTMNLNEIECIKAESIPDSDDISEQFSFVVSPISEQIHFEKKLTAAQIWSSEFMQQNSQLPKMKNLADVKVLDVQI